MKNLKSVKSVRLTTARSFTSLSLSQLAKNFEAQPIQVEEKTSFSSLRTNTNNNFPSFQHQNKSFFSSSSTSSPSTFSRTFHSSSLRMQEQKTQQEQKSGEDAKDKRIKELEAALEEAKTNLKYSYAERENIRRIGLENAKKDREYGIQSFAKSLLNVHDNLNRALSNLKPEKLNESSTEVKSFVEGIQLTQRELAKIFSQNGIQEFSPKDGEKFDPNVMNALLEVPDPSKENGTIAFCLKPGFVLKDRVLRAADVGVVKGGKPATPAANNENATHNQNTEGEKKQ